MRYNPTERLGVIETDKAITKDLGWVFREQSIVDVGIDAIIEQVEDNMPTGMFSALQIKSGESNFYITEKHLIYYMSNVHKNYWTRLNIPIFLIAYLPKIDIIYWHPINKFTIEKSKKSWKIKIPKTQQLNKNSKDEISKNLKKISTNNIISNFYTIDFSAETSFGIEIFQDSLQSTLKIKILIDDLGSIAKKYTERQQQLYRLGITNESKIYQEALKQQGRGLCSIAMRLESEATIFSEVFPEEFRYLEKYLYFLKSTNDFGLETLREVLTQTPIQLQKALDGLSMLRDVAASLSKTQKALRMAQTALLESIDMLLVEYIDAQYLVNRVLENINPVERKLPL